jgi:hypothetical protein
LNRRVLDYQFGYGLRGCSPCNPFPFPAIIALMDGKGGSLEEAFIVNWAGSGIVWQASIDMADA